jgi:hypothetical protein
MRLTSGTCLGLVIAVSALPGCVEPPAKPLDRVQEEAAWCANSLAQFAIVQRDFFPDGLETAKPEIGVEALWPPPPSWSWRVAVLPYMEQAYTYKVLHDLSDGFKLPGTLSDDQLEKHPDLKGRLAWMPEWMTIERWKKETGKTIYRRIVVVDRPTVFIVVESSELVPWWKGDDDLVMDEKGSLPKMGGNFPTGFFALCGDGKVRFLPKTLTDKELRKALLTGEGAPAIRGRDIHERKKDIAKLDLGK